MFIKKLIAYVPYHALLAASEGALEAINNLPDGKHEHIEFALHEIYCGLVLWSVWWGEFGGFSDVD